MNLLTVYYIVCVLFGLISVYVNDRKHSLDVKIHHVILTFFFNTALCPALILVWLVFGIPRKLYDPFLHVVQ